MPWDFVLILAVLAILLPWRGYVRVRELLRRPLISGEERVAVYLSTMLVQWSAALFVLWRCRARGLSLNRLGIAISDAQLTFGVGFALSLVLVLVQFTGLRRMARLPVERQGLLADFARKLMPAAPREQLIFAALSATVALCEEFLYRGFALAALDDALGDVLLATVASSVLFALAHLYQGRRGVVSTFVVGLIFAGARQYTGSLAPCVAAHFTADLVAGLAAPRMLRRAAVEGRPVESNK